MSLKPRSRWQASALHLAISVLIGLGVLLVMLELWYPTPLFEAAGGNGLLFLVVGVDVVIGPLITLVIFAPGKPGLKLDLSVIAALQTAALAYGVHIVYLAHPAYLVFVKDRFEVATPVDLAPAELARARFAEFKRVPLGAPEFVASDFPTDPQERNALVKAALSGLDVQNFPRYWVPYAQRTKEVLAKAETIEQLRKSDPEVAKAVDGYLARSQTPAASVRYLGLRAREAWVAVLVDPKTARPLKMLIAQKL